LCCVHRFEAHRAEQKKAAENAAKKKSGRIRTPFAHGAPDGRAADAETAAKTRAKSLN
jgi:hypothetical protein